MRKKELAATTSLGSAAAVTLDPRAFNLTKAAYSINEVLDNGPCGRTSLYAAIKAGKLRAVKHGKKTIVLAADYAAFLAGLPQKAA